MSTLPDVADGRQPAGSESWYAYACQQGTFMVLGRFHGSTDVAQCRA
jgi:hypothetical protein